MTDQETEILTTLDESQRTVVLAQDGYHLVLAPPGCGKTHILASRVRWAHSHGVAFEDMLCLTFTNRAARGMINRIGEVMDGEDLAPLHVGNVHHYCSRFLFEQQVVPADSSIVSDEETISILADYTHDDEERVIRDYQSSRNYQQILFFSHLMDQMRHGHPWSLYLHPEALTEGDREALRYLCNRQKKPFAVEALIEIYPCAENYFDDADAAPREVAGKVRTLLKKMYYARRYAEYKADNHILDFEDLLLKTYDAYREDTEGRLRRYRWIQVDEVQDLNAMQLAIIDLLTAKERATVLFLGDEQQAIFSFMGAKVERLNEIKLRCKGHIHHLRQNHRAPSYLLGVLNRYAEAQLGIDSELLPLAGNDEQAQPGDLQIIYGATMEDEIRLICEKVRELQTQGTTAVVVSSNADANRVSQSLTDQGLTHFKVSGRDLFDTPDVRLLFAHLSVLSNEHNFIPWARILRGVGVFDTHSLARRFSRKLLQLALTPDDLLRYDGTTYLQEFLKAYDGGEIVVFDTETTGTDVYHDDIIEVSAMRVCQGRVVGEPLDLYIETDRPIPTLLGEKENPMYALYHQKMAAGELLQAEEALVRFLAFVGDRPVVGHNVRFDYQILRYNLLRHGGLRLPIPMGRVFDTLKLMRLLDRNLRSYKLESLIDQLGLQGANTHQAIDDVGATVSLVNYCAASGRSRVKAQTDFLAHPRVRPFASKLRAYYGDLYLDAMARCYDLEADADQPALVKELRRAYAYFVEEHKVDEIPQLDDICRYIMMDLLPRQEVANSLDAQLQRYIVDLSTLKESDFCNSRSIRERIYVTTVHKAKGLEYDNVIIFDAVDGRYPNAYNRDKKQDMEDARKFYVALSRARRRLFVAYSMNTTDRHGVVHPRQLTPFMDEIMAYFG